MEKLRPKEWSTFSRATQPLHSSCQSQFVLDSVWRAFSFPELMDYWLLFRKNAQRSFLCSPLWKLLLFLLSGNAKSIWGRTILRCVWRSQEFQGVSIFGPAVAARVTAVMPSHKHGLGWQCFSGLIPTAPDGDSETKMMKSPCPPPYPAPRDFWNNSPH